MLLCSTTDYTVHSQDFVQLGFSGGEEDDEYDEEDAALLGF